MLHVSPDNDPQIIPLVRIYFQKLDLVVPRKKRKSVFQKLRSDILNLWRQNKKCKKISAVKQAAAVVAGPAPFKNIKLENPIK